MTSVANISMFRRVSSSDKMPNCSSATRMPKPVRSRMRSMPASTVFGLPISAVPLSISALGGQPWPPPSARRMLMKFFIEPIEV